MPPRQTLAWQTQALSPDELVASIRSGMNVFIHGGYAHAVD